MPVHSSADPAQRLHALLRRVGAMSSLFSPGSRACAAEVPRGYSVDRPGVALTPDEVACAETITLVWEKMQYWMLRKVDSIRMESEQRARRRISIDLLVPSFPELAYQENERSRSDIDQVDSPLMLPLTLMGKGTLRDLDVEVDGKQACVLTTQENAVIAELAVLLESAPDAPDPEGLRRDVGGIIKARPREAERLLKEFTAQWITGAEVPALTETGQALLRELASSFLLIVLVPAGLAGQRIIVKYAYHWDRILHSDASKPPPWRIASDLWVCARPAFGISSLSLEVEVNSASEAQSYHLEVHAPPSLTFTALAMPEDDQGGEVASDVHVGQVAHGVARYSSPPQLPATLEVTGINTGLRSAAWVVTAYTAAIFLLSYFLPGAFAAWRGQGSRAAPLLLAVPAAAMSMMARQEENVVAAYFWRPLRVVVVTCAALLMAGAAAVAIGLEQRWMTVLWFLGFTLPTAAWLLLTWGICASMSPRDPEEPTDDA